MDGLLINTEDLYFTCMDNILAKYHKPPIPWSLRPRLMGVPSAVADSELYAWANLPISREEFEEGTRTQRPTIYSECELLPGVETLLADLKYARGQDGSEIAMASSSTTRLYGLKISRPEIGDVFKNVFNESNRILGDNPGLKAGTGKPAPDIYLLALDVINAKLEHKIKPEECLVFDDSVPGVESGRRAGMRVIWVPHPELRTEYKGREEEVLAGRSGFGVASENSMMKRRSSLTRLVTDGAIVWKVLRTFRMRDMESMSYCKDNIGHGQNQSLGTNDES